MPAYYPQNKWLLSLGRWSILLDKRVAGVFLLLLLLLATGIIASLSLGSTMFGLGETWATLQGRGEDLTRMILFEIRLPRVVATLTAGFALGLAGCISQTIFRNRLATPDILGINEGATLAIVAFVLSMTVASWPFWIAPLGALLAVFVLYKVCAGRDMHGSVLIVIGICFSEFLRAVVEFLMSMGALHEVQSIYIWLQGSFIGQGYQTSLPVLAILAATLPVQFYIARQLDILRLPAPVANGLGVDVRRLQAWGICTVAVLAAIGASIGGPVAFIAMAAPILVATMVKDRTPALWCSGLLGAALLLASDTIARTIVQPEEVAAGVVTRILGGIFLLYLLIKDGAK